MATAAAVPTIKILDGSDTHIVYLLEEKYCIHISGLPEDIASIESETLGGDGPLNIYIDLKKA
jgi:hypothetical protein